MDALKADSEIVLVSGADLHLSPEIVQEAMASDEALGPTPIVAVFDAKVQTLLGVVPYEKMKTASGFAAVKEKLAGLKGAAAEAPKALASKIETWTSIEGRTIAASFVNVSGGNVTLRMDNGRTVSFGLDRLDAASKEKALSLAGAN